MWFHNMAPKMRDVRTRNCTNQYNLTIVPDDELPREDDVMLHGDKGESSAGRGLRSGVDGDREPWESLVEHM